MLVLFAFWFRMRWLAPGPGGDDTWALPNSKKMRRDESVQYIGVAATSFISIAGDHVEVAMASALRTAKAVGEDDVVE